MLNVGPLTAEIVSRVWGTQQISTSFASWLRYRTDVTQRKSTKLCAMFGRLLGWYTVYTFWGSCPLTEFTLRPSLALSYIGSVTARHSSSGRQPNCGVVSATGRPSRSTFGCRNVYSYIGLTKLSTLLRHDRLSEPLLISCSWL